MNPVEPVINPLSNADIPPCLGVVMPVFNEEATVASVIRRVLEQRPGNLGNTGA